jgi:hypothetical protein
MRVSLARSLLLVFISCPWISSSPHKVFRFQVSVFASDSPVPIFIRAWPAGSSLVARPGPQQRFPLSRESISRVKFGSCAPTSVRPEFSACEAKARDQRFPLVFLRANILNVLVAHSYRVVVFLWSERFFLLVFFHGCRATPVWFLSRRIKIRVFLLSHHVFMVISRSYS